MSENEKYVYRTSDIYFSAYLKAIDIPLLETEAEEKPNSRNKKLFFIFDVGSKEELSELKKGYFGGDATVSAQKFVQAIRSLKSLCFV